MDYFMHLPQALFLRGCGIRNKKRIAMKILKITMSTIVIIIALLILVFLIPPHIQIRGIKPVIPSENELRQLQEVSNRPISIRYVNTATQKTPTGQISHSAFVIEWKNGTVFLIDTSMDDNGAMEFGAGLENMIGADKTQLKKSLPQQLGEIINNVKGLAFTHMHIDHTQGLNLLCENLNSKPIIYQTELQSEEVNLHTNKGSEIIQNSCLHKSVIKGEGLLMLENFPGLAIIPVGGHTPGSTIFAVAVNDKLWILSGDISNSKADLLNNQGKGFIYSYLFIPENTSRTEALRLWLTQLDQNKDISVIVSHDLDATKKNGLLQFH